jgi:hypothetical protein
MERCTGQECASRVTAQRQHSLNRLETLHDPTHHAADSSFWSM